MTHELHDNPKLTAFALGELDAAQSADLQKQLDQDERLRQEVEVIRQTAAQLRTELQAEPSGSLTDAQRRSIEEGPPGPLNRPSIFTVRRMLIGGPIALAAACLALVFILPIWTRSGSQPGDEFARGERNEAAGGAMASGEEADASRVRGLETLANGQVAESERQSGATSTIDELAAPIEQSEITGLVAADLAEEGRQGFARKSAAGDVGAPTPPAKAAAPRTDAPAPTRGGGLGGGGGVGRDAGGASPGRRKPPSGGRASTPAVPGEPMRTRPRTAAPAPAAAPGAGAAPGQERLREEFAIQADEDALGAPRDAEDRRLAREQYDPITDNPFQRPNSAEPSTFSIDVDTASYSNVRRMIESGMRPPADAVRIEEFINYFSYDYAPPDPEGPDPLAVHVEVGPAPWQADHRLVRIGLKGYEVDPDMRPATSLVFLLDVSGSMRSRKKLPLVKQSMQMLLSKLNGDDRIAIVTYAGEAGLVLPSTYVRERGRINDAIQSLHAGGSTNGAGGIEVAYRVAQEHFIEGGVNRVILCTDGDFNVGVSDDGSLVRLIEAKRASGVFLSVYGFGSGNLQDAKMEKLSGAGNGTYGYIDGFDEAEKVFVDELSGTLVTIAKDVKIQVEFNPARVAAYRLIGYENRVLAAQDFRNDRKDAGEVGAGHTVTALYEVVPVGVEIDLPEVPEPRYAADDAGGAVPEEVSGELLTVRLRFKKPDGQTSQERQFPITDAEVRLEDTSADFRFAAAVASFGMILRDSPYKGDTSLLRVAELASSGRGEDQRGLRAGFLELLEQAQEVLGD